MKILASLGTHSQDFSRMARAIDTLAGKNPEYEITVQMGVTRYEFRHPVVYFDFCPKDQMELLIEEADILILQGGWGGMEEAVDKGKRCVVIPRIEGPEHIHDQEQLVRKMDELGHIVGCFDENDLEKCVEAAKTLAVKPIVKGSATDVINNALEKWFL